MNNHFKNKTIWLTGASEGLGEQLAYQLAEQQAKLILSARNQHRLEQVRANCANAEKHKVVVLDLSQIGQLSQIAKQVVADNPDISILINNAGIGQRSEVVDTETAVEQRMMAVNYWAPVLLTKMLLPHFIAQQQGHIVNVLSVMAKIATARRSSYSASKHALMGYMDALRCEQFDNGIKVSNFCPGYIATGFSSHALHGLGQAHAQADNIRLKGLQPDKLAKLILRATVKGRPEAYFGGVERLAVWLSRFCPVLWRVIARNLQIS